MQQLNILPINISQKVEVKDESIVLNSTSSKDEFSQHIDLHLAKSKDATHEEKRVVSEKFDASTVKTKAENTNQKVDDKTLQSSTTSLATADETDSANSTQEVAASGNKGEKLLSTEYPEKLSEQEQVVDESTLLMSFLMKADKTLVKENPVENIKLSEIPAEQKAKYEAQLLLKASGLVADLSGVAKALNATSEATSVVLSEQEQSSQVVLTAVNNTKTNSETDQLKIKTLIEGGSLGVDGSATTSVGKLNINIDSKTANDDFELNKGRFLKQQINAAKLDGQSVENTSVDDKDVVAAAQKLGVVQLAKNDSEGKISNKTNENDDNVDQKQTPKELIKQPFIPEGKSAESNNIASKSLVNEQAITNVQNSLEVDTTIKEKIAQLTQNKNSIVNNKKESLTSAIAASQNANSNKNSSEVKASTIEASLEVKASAVPSLEVKASAVPSPEVKASAVPLPEVKASAVPSPEVKTSAVPSPEVKASAVPSPEVKTSAVPSPEVKASAVPSPEVKTSAVPSPEVKASVVNISEVNASAVNISQTSTETTLKQSALVTSETQLSTKSVEHLIEQDKALNLGKNKEISNKVLFNTNSDFSINSDFSEVTGRATQVAQNIADQQVTDVFNPIASSEVSQSQKTNTQLHQETVAIFRKDFADAVKDKVMLIISQKLQQFDITLDPPELGNIHVKVNLQGEQATVNFVVQNQQAKEVFEQNMHKLKELLAEQGVDVGDANVEQQSQQSSNTANNEETAADNNHNTMTNTADAGDVIEHNLSANMLNSSTSAVDYYA